MPKELWQEVVNMIWQHPSGHFQINYLHEVADGMINWEKGVDDDHKRAHKAAINASHGRL